MDRPDKDTVIQMAGKDMKTWSNFVVKRETYTMQPWDLT